MRAEVSLKECGERPTFRRASFNSNNGNVDATKLSSNISQGAVCPERCGGHGAVRRRNNDPHSGQKK
jgi:hypothetical protein